MSPVPMRCWRCRAPPAWPLRFLVHVASWFSSRRHLVRLKADPTIYFDDLFRRSISTIYFGAFSYHRSDQGSLLSIHATSIRRSPLMSAVTQLLAEIPASSTIRCHV